MKRQAWTLYRLVVTTAANPERRTVFVGWFKSRALAQAHAARHAQGAGE